MHGQIHLKRMREQGSVGFPQTDPSLCLLQNSLDNLRKKKKKKRAPILNADAIDN